MPARSLMIQGTGSNAGKSALVTGLGRLLRRKGLLTAPFKPQNMALNSAVTADGGEIGRAQALQAQACGVPAQIDMNPVLLKPCTGGGAQVIVQGKVNENNMNAADYHAYKKELMPAVLDSYQRLSDRFDYILVEGAGSPAEINLRDGDIANMGFAEAVHCPVILVSDIDRGGVFAHLFGTLELLSDSERNLVKGFIINKFRGDLEILKPGIDWLKRETGKPVLGVLPYLNNLRLDAEDSLSNSNVASSKESRGTQLKVVVVHLPSMSNQTDFDPLAGHPQVDLRYASEPGDASQSDLIILPGTKSVRDDLYWLEEQKWDEHIRRHLRYGGKVLGICGGFQMLGGAIDDPRGVESGLGSTRGLGLFDMVTVLGDRKTLRCVDGTLTINEALVSGYEIHMGVSSGPALNQCAVRIKERTDGAISDDNQIMGTYLHGLFDRSEALGAILSWAGLKEPEAFDYATVREANINLLADALEENLGVNMIFKILGVKN